MDELEFQMNGQPMRLSRQQVIDRIKGQHAESIQTWAVEIEGELFPVKQAFAEATGLGRTSFISHRARDLLQRLGFRVLDVSRQLTSGRTAELNGTSTDSDRVSVRLIALSLAAQCLSGRSDIRVSDVLDTAATFEKWVTRP